MNKLTAKSAHEKLILAALAHWQFLKNSDHQSPIKNGRHTFACLAIVATSLTDLKNKLASLRDQLQSGARQIKDPRGIYFMESDTNLPYQPGKLAFLFPGQGSQYPGMLCDLAVRFAEVSETFAQADQLLKNKLEKLLSAYIFPMPVFSKEEGLLQKEILTDTRIAQPAMGAADMAALALIKALGIKPDMMAGHSYGEYVALCAAGHYDFKNLMDISAERGEILAQQPDSNGQGGTMAAVSCSPDELAAYLPDKSNNITLANYNSPKQIVIAGTVNDIEQAIKTLENQGVVARRIAVSQAFHTQSMKEAAKKLAAVLQKIKFLPAAVDVYSNQQGQKYERQTASNIAAKLAAHTVEPVDFVKQINNMYNDGARIFLEVGAGNVLSNLAQSILADHTDVTCISLDRQGRDGVTNLLHALAQLAVNGVHIDWQRLYQYRLDSLTAFFDSHNAPETSLQRGGKKLVHLINAAGVRPKESDTSALSPRSSSESLKTMQPFTGSPANKAVPALSSSSTTKGSAIGVTTSSSNSAEQIMLQFQQTMQEMANSFLETQQRVMLAFLESQNGRASSSNTQSNVQPSSAEFTTSPVVVELQSAGTQAAVYSAATEQPAKVDTEYLINSLIEIVAERTGYPVDMIDPALDLEADLGIDSIKRVEILNKFRRLLPESTQQKLESGIEELAGTRTLQGLIDWLRIHQDADAALVEIQPAQLSYLDKHDGNGGNGGNGKHDATARAFVSAKAHTGFNGGNGKDGQHTTEVQESGVIRRALVAPVLLPKLSFDRDQITAKMREIQRNGQVALITGDKLGLAEHLSESLKQYGFTPVILRHVPTQAMNTGSYDVDLENSEQVQACLTDCENTLGKFSMLFHLQSFGEESASLNRTSAVSLLHLLKYTSNKTEKQQRIVAITSMGGKFGIEQSVNGDMSDDFFHQHKQLWWDSLKLLLKNCRPVYAKPLISP